MTSSRKPDDLPPAGSSMWRLCRLGLRYEPSLMVWAFVLALVAAVPDALLALWFKLMADAIVAGDATKLRLTAIALGLSAAGTWFLRTVSTRVQRRFRDKVTIALESHVARLQATIATIAHQEVPEYLDRIAMLRDQVFVLDHMYMALFSMAGWILRLAVTLALLVSVHPALALLAVFALPTVFTAAWRPGVERAAQERAAPFNRLARHLFAMATTASPAKEVRLTGIGERLRRDRRAAWESGHRPIAATRWGSMMWHTAAWAIFASVTAISSCFASMAISGWCSRSWSSLASSRCTDSIAGRAASGASAPSPIQRARLVLPTRTRRLNSLALSSSAASVLWAPMTSAWLPRPPR